jgi:predicted nucleic acid-binding protein
MRDEVLLDASVVADWLFPGPRLELTLAFVRPELRKIAPDLIFAEFISVAAKAVRRGLVSETIAWAAVERLPALIDDVAPLGDLALPAYALATRHGFSTYDGVYLALALRRNRPLVTADAKLARRAIEVGLAGHIRLVSPES